MSQNNIKPRGWLQIMFESERTLLNYEYHTGWWSPPPTFFQRIFKIKPKDRWVTIRTPMFEYKPSPAFTK